MNVKKLLATVLTIALLASFASAFALTSSAQEDVAIIPKVETHPTIDGVISEGEWAGAYTEILDYETASVKFSHPFEKGTYADVNPTASVKVSIVWYMGPNDEYGDYYPIDDTEGGLYYLLEVIDTTKPWYVGINGEGSREANATDGIQIFVDPGNYKSSSPGTDSYCYTFVPCSAGGPGIGVVPSGAGFWWEFMQYNGGENGIYDNFAEIASAPDFTFDPAYPLPDGDPDAPGYKPALDSAYQNATQNGYTIEGFIAFYGLSFKGGESGDDELYMVNNADTAVGTQFGMALALIDYLYDGPSNPIGDEVKNNQHIIACMGNINGEAWTDIGYPDTYKTYELGPAVPDASISLNTNVAEVGKEITATIKLDSSKTPVGGLTLDLVYDKTALELVSTEDEILKSVGFKVDEYEGQKTVSINTDYNGTGVRFLGINLGGVEAPCQIMKVKFKVLKAIDTFPAFSITVDEMADVNAKVLNADITTAIVNVTKGDVDGNDKIELADAMKAFQHVAGKITLTGDAFTAADINENTKVELDDAMKIFQFVAGKITQF